MEQWYNPEQLYTMNVILSKQTQDKLKALQFTDIKGSQLPLIRLQVWTQGLSYKQPDTGIIELIPPGSISTVTILPQKTV